MTTTITILVQGNKEVEVKTTNDPAPTKIKPGQFCVKQIHGEVKVEVTEIGEFLS